IGVWGGGVWPNDVESSGALGVRVDLGYAGPGLRIVPTFGYFSSRMKASEVRELSDRVEDLVDEQDPAAPPVSVDLGPIEWDEFVLGLDGQFVWAVPGNFLTYVGAGVSGHLTNGSGSGINGTFVEDLIDTFTAGVNAHGGFEYLATDRVRFFTEVRYEVRSDLRYPELRSGVTLFFTGPAPGEERRR
ncbi:MAG: hypothetical protein RQ745_12335, partial [Longimicrobiales bacterium]|nr:hypothetical protein [Longimicrobiales bacterium]